MDSSRNGLLSTLLMTLPLIVVPAIALLRPPGQGAGVSTSPLDASDSSDDDFLSDLTDLETALNDPQKDKAKQSSEDTSEFDGLFEEAGEEASDANRTQNDERNQGAAPARPHGESNPFVPFEPDDRDGTPSDPDLDETPGGGAEGIVNHLNSNGALRTMWFDAGPKSPVGFAAFFRGKTDLVRFRFEAVGQTREECARSVLDQVRRWQAKESAGGQ